MDFLPISVADASDLRIPTTPALPSVLKTNKVVSGAVTVLVAGETLKQVSAISART